MLQIRRSVAYEQTTKEVSKWDPIVEQNRKVTTTTDNKDLILT